VLEPYLSGRLKAPQGACKPFKFKARGDRPDSSVGFVVVSEASAARPARLRILALALLSSAKAKEQCSNAQGQADKAGT